MELKLLDTTLPGMEDKPKSWNTQSDKGPFIKLMDSWITQELRRITLAKIDEIKLVYFLNKTPLAFIDENGSTYIGALTMRITKDTSTSISSPLKLLINDPFKLITIRYVMVDCNWI